MKRALWREYVRHTWHGYPDGWDAFLALPLSDRYLAAEALDELIQVSNEQGANRPKEDR